MRRLIQAVAAVAVVAAAPVHAETWPQHAVRMVVPFDPGGNTDTIARLTAQALTQSLGQPFVVENRAGAAGAIAAEYVARAAPDGYTLCVCTLSQTAAVPLTHKVAYDPLKDFTPVAEIGANGFVITVSPELPTPTLRDFIAYVKQRPGQLNYASGGIGTLTHLSALLFLKRAGLAMTHVPYKGGGPSIAETMANHVQMYSASPSEVVSFAGTGKLRLLGISSRKRIPQLPDVPTIAEIFPGFHAETWNGLLAPAGTPPAVVSRIAGAVDKAMRSPDFAGHLEKLGVEPTIGTPAEFAKLVRDDYALWRKVITEAGLTAE